MSDDKNISGEAMSDTRKRGRSLTELADRSHTGLSSTRSTPGMMCQQGADWSRGHSCIPQKFVQLIGHRDPMARSFAPLPQRQMHKIKTQFPSDTPIG